MKTSSCNKIRYILNKWRKNITQLFHTYINDLKTKQTKLTMIKMFKYNLYRMSKNLLDQTSGTD